MIIELKPGESVFVKLKDTDGEFKITYGHCVLSITADMPDTQGRVGTIYKERFAWTARQTQSELED